MENVQESSFVNSKLIERKKQTKRQHSKEGECVRLCMMYTELTLKTVRPTLTFLFLTMIYIFHSKHCKNILFA